MDPRLGFGSTIMIRPGDVIATDSGEVVVSYVQDSGGRTTVMGVRKTDESQFQIGSRVHVQNKIAKGEWTITGYEVSYLSRETLHSELIRIQSMIEKDSLNLGTSLDVPSSSVVGGGSSWDQSKRDIQSAYEGIHNSLRLFSLLWEELKDR